VKLIMADEHKGLKAAAAKVPGAAIQRCRVHFMRNALACWSAPLSLDRIRRRF
jgi:transposase-like protein